LGNILKQQGKNDLAFQHFSLSKLIRQEEEWKIPQKLMDELSLFSLPEIINIIKLKKDLRQYWDSFKQIEFKKNIKKDDALKGEIIRITRENDRGKAGYIKSNENEYSFFLPYNFHLTKKINVGSKVNFIILPATNEKKAQIRITKLIE
jgi:hypothetical protein